MTGRIRLDGMKTVAILGTILIATATKPGVARGQLKPINPAALSPTGAGASTPVGAPSPIGAGSPGGSVAPGVGVGGNYIGYPAYGGYGFGYPSFGGVGGFAAPYGIGSRVGYGGGYGYDVSGWGSGYGTGWGFGYGRPYGLGGGIGAYGASPYSLAASQNRSAALAANRNKLLNAEAVKDYQAANLYRQEAANEAAKRYRTAYPISPRYGLGSEDDQARQAPQPEPRNSLMPPDQVVDRDGNIRWPASTPTGEQLNERRQAVDDAVRTLAQESHGRKHPSIRSVVQARDALDGFAQPALDRLRSDKSDDAQGMEDFLNSLDHALVLAGTDARPTTNAPPAHGDIRPDDAPKSGGDVLRESIKDGAESQATRDGVPTPKPATPERSQP